jgi:hypothetical protein
MVLGWPGTILAAAPVMRGRCKIGMCTGVFRRIDEQLTTFYLLTNAADIVAYQAHPGCAGGGFRVTMPAKAT